LRYISGNWKGTAETPNGTVERTFVFKVDGHKLTGETTSSMFGKSTIEDGKVDGDDVSFTVTVNIQGNEGKVNYKGKIEGDTINFKIQDRGASHRPNLGNDRQTRSLSTGELAFK
jgi:hypothetical protein